MQVAPITSIINNNKFVYLKILTNVWITNSSWLKRELCKAL